MSLDPHKLLVAAVVERLACDPCDWTFCPELVPRGAGLCARHAAEALVAVDRAVQGFGILFAAGGTTDEEQQIP